jgi:hypothetical protein
MNLMQMFGAGYCAMLEMEHSEKLDYIEMPPVNLIQTPGIEHQKVLGMAYSEMPKMNTEMPKMHSEMPEKNTEMSELNTETPGMNSDTNL